MKKTITFLSRRAAVLLLAMMLTTATAWAQTTITPTTPSQDGDGYYLIGSAAELYGFAQLVNNGNATANAKLTADIVVNENVLDANGEANTGDFVQWTPIGNSSGKVYSGTFDGQGHTISGLYVSGSGLNVGLIGAADGSVVVKNLGVVDSYFGSSNNYIGSIVSNVSNGSTVTIANVFSTSTVAGDDYVGGLVASDRRGSVTIINSYFAGKTSANWAYGTLHDDLVSGGFDNSTPTVCNAFVLGTSLYGTQATAAQLSDGTVAAALHYYQDALADGSMWGISDGKTDFSGTLDGVSVTTADITLHTFDGDAMVYSSKYVVGNTTPLPVNVEREGYTFLGWYDNANLEGNAVTQISSSETGNKEYWAKFERSHSVTFVLNDGYIQTGEIDHYIEGETTVLPTVVFKNSASFEGWYTTENFTGDRYYSIPATATEDMTFYAKWGEEKTEFYLMQGNSPEPVNILYEGENIVWLDETTMGRYVISDNSSNLWGSNSVINVPYTGGESTFGLAASGVLSVAQSGFYVFTLTDKGEGNWFVSVLKSMLNCDVASIPTQVYTGSAIEPAVTVTDGETTLTLGTDYEVAYSNNVNAGTATATITGKGNYSGETAATFTIVYPTVTTSYVDATGTLHENVEAVPLDNTMTTLAAGTYVVNSDITYTGTVTLAGDVNIILADGKTMNVGTANDRIASGNCINAGTEYSLTIYGQTLQTGILNAFNSDKEAVYLKNYTQHGGNVTIDATKKDAIRLYGNDLTLTRGTLNVNASDTEAAISFYNTNTSFATVSGGNLTASGGYYGINGNLNMIGGNVSAISSTNDFAIYKSATISSGTLTATGDINGNVTFTGGTATINGNIWSNATLGWTNADDRITASSYYGTVTIVEGKSMSDGTTTYNSGDLNDDQKAAIAGKTLQPAVKITLPTGVTASGTNVFNQTDGTYALPNATATIAAATGYTISDVSATGANLTDNGDGTYTLTVGTTDVTVTATVTAKTYTVTLDRQGATTGSESATATYDADMPAITLPTRTGYDFVGYFTETDGGGTQYYNADGTSTRPWDIDAATTLYAKWETISIVEDGITYKWTSGTNVKVTECNNSWTSITIPASVVHNGETYDVTEIGEEAFMGNTSLTAIDMSTYNCPITIIHTRAFKNCTDLSSILLPASLTTIEDEAFSGCDLTEITIPASVEYLSENAFENCNEDLIIYVPKDEVSSCRNKWPAYAAIIHAEGAIPYIAADGSKVYCEEYTVLDNTMTTISEGWYVVNSDVDFSGDLSTNADGEVNIILCDGATLTANNIEPQTNNDYLCIYGQSQGTGTANISGDIMGNYSISIYGGTINATGNITCPQGGIGIYGGTITAGRFDASETGAQITLGGATVKANSYSAYDGVTILPGITYYDGEGHSYTEGNLSADEIAAIAGKKLRTYDYRTVSYVKADGTTGSVDAIPLTGGGATTLAGGWYVAQGTVDYTGCVTLNGDAHLILCDGAEMIVTCDETAVQSSGALTIYGQSGGTGTLTLKSNQTTISVIGNLTICSGSVSATSSGDDVIKTTGDIILKGGTLTACADDGTSRAINCSGTLNLSGGKVVATKGAIYAENGATIASGLAYTDGSTAYTTSISSNDLEALGAVTLELADIVITSANFAQYFDYIGDFEYNNATPNTSTTGGYFLKDGVPVGSTLDFQGEFIPDATGNYNPRIFINKRVNITSSDKSAVFKPYKEDNNERYWWDFGILEGADYTEVKNLKFENCWVFNHGSSYVTFDGIDMKVEDVRIGSGIGALSICTIKEGGHASDHTTVKNSVFYTRNNGGNTSLMAGCGAPYITFDNNKVTLEGNVGNGIYASVYNTFGDKPEYGTFTNNVVTNEGPAKGTCWCILPCGQGNLIENNTVNYAGNAIYIPYGSPGLSDTSKKNIYRNNTTTLGGSISVYEYSVVENNQVSGQLSVAKGATATGNTVAGMTVSGQDATIKNNTVNGNVTISKTTASFTDNAINGMLTLNSASGGANDNNTITGNVILSTGQHAIELKSSGNTVSGNILISADYEGDAAVKTTWANTIADNTLAAYESATASSHSNTPYIITSETTAIKAGDNAGTFYYVPTDATVTINGDFAITPNEGATSPKVNLMLGNGSQLNVGNISGSDCSLTLYGQSMDGMLTATGTISAKNINLSGATVKANGYSGTVNIASGKTYYDGTGASYTGTLTSSEVTAIVGKTLRTYDYRTVEYVAADGTTATADAIPLTGGGATTLAGGWYVAQGTVNYTGCVTLNGDVNLILADNAVVNIGTSSDRISDNYCILGDNNSLTIYGQSTEGDNVGQLNAYNSSDDYSAVYVKNYTQYGGTVNATGQYGIIGDVTLGWTNATDRIYASSYSGTVTIAAGQSFINDAAMPEIVSGTITDMTKVNGKTLTPAIVLADNADNTSAIATAATVCTGGKTIAVQLSGRTLYKDGDWNTLCLPFSLGNSSAEEGHYFDGTLLAGATVKELDGSTSNLNSEGLLTLNFSDATSIEAGKPYIVKWQKAADYDADPTAYDIVNPVFSNVTVDDTKRDVDFTGGSFKGNYDPLEITAATNRNSIVVLAAGNKLGYTTTDRTIANGKALGSFHAYFEIPGPTQASSFVLNTDDESTQTGIGHTEITDITEKADAIYDLQGRRVENPKKGLYIVNGRKVVIK